MKFALEELFVGELGLVFSDEGRGEVAAHGVFDDFGILAGAEQHADGGVFVGLFRIAVERFEVEAEFAEVFRLEAADLEFDGDEAIQAAMEEEEVERKIPPADLERELGADEAEITAQFDEEVAELEQQTLMEIGLAVAGREIKEFEQVAVLEDGEGFRVDLC